MLIQADFTLAGIDIPTSFQHNHIYASTFKGLPLRELDVDSTRISYSNFAAVVFNKPAIDHCIVEDSVFNCSKFSSGHITRSRFKNCDFTASTFMNTYVIECLFDTCNFDLFQFAGSRLQSCIFTNCSFNRTDFSTIRACSSLFSNCQAKNIKLTPYVDGLVTSILEDRLNLLKYKGTSEDKYIRFTGALSYIAKLRYQNVSEEYKNLVVKYFYQDSLDWIMHELETLGITI